MRIVFMGTPRFAVPCLERIVNLGHEVAAVYTQPDKPQGRGYKMLPPPVKVFAEAHGIKVMQPKTLRDESAAADFRALSPEFAVVVAYGKILPPDILAVPKHGCINVHASLLPKYRGAAPIQWSIINGETETGVTTMLLNEGMDTGDMLLKKATPIHPDETADMLHDRLMLLGADCLEETLELLEKGQMTPIKQNDAKATYAPLITADTARIDFGKTAGQIKNLVRAMNSQPGAYTYFAGRRLKVYKAEPVAYSGAAGEILDARRLIVGCAGGAVELLEVQPEGGKRMSARDFANGQKVQAGQKLGD